MGRVIRIVVGAAVLWGAFSVGSTHGPDQPLDCYDQAVWDGAEWQYTGHVVCLGEEE